MKKLLLAAFLLLAANPAFATAFGAGTQWDIQATGSDVAGGGFDPGVGSPGTNESLGSGTAVTITLTGTTTGTSLPAISSTTHGPGNFVHIASGSGCTVGWYEILSQSSGTATFNVAIGSSTNVCVGVLGGSLLTWNEALNVLAITGNTVWVQSGTYTRTTTTTVNGTNMTAGFVIGYAATHGDGGTAPILTTATNSVPLLTFSSFATQGFIIFQNLSFSTTASSKADGFFASAALNLNLVVKKCILNGFAIGIDGYDSGAGYFYSVEVFDTLIENTTSYGMIAYGMPGSVIVERSVFKSTGGPALYFHTGGTSTLTAINNVFTGISGIGIEDGGASGPQVIVEGNSFVSTTSNAVSIDSPAAGSSISVANNIFYGSSSSPVNLASTTMTIIENGHNAYGGNTSGNVNFPAGDGDVTLTASPYTSSSNFALNSTAGGGTLLKAAGIPGTSVQGTVGYLDIGAFQSQSSAGGGASNFGSSN